MSAANTFKAGDTVYGQHGQEAEFVARSAGEYIVRPFYEDEDGTHTGDVETWSTVFRTPPAPKLDAQTATAEKRLAELQLEVGELEGQKYALERGEKERIERIKRHTELADLDRYLAGEITHYVAVHDYYPTVEIIPVAETMENYASNDRYGLLQLYPSPAWDKTVRWTVSYRTKTDWRDDRTVKVIPCCGEEAATATAVALLNAYVVTQLATELSKRRYTAQLVASCRARGVAVPQELLDGIAATERANVERSLDEVRAKAEALEQQLAALIEGGAAS